MAIASDIANFNPESNSYDEAQIAVFKLREIISQVLEDQTEPLPAKLQAIMVLKGKSVELETRVGTFKTIAKNAKIDATSKSPGELQASKKAYELWNNLWVLVTKAVSQLKQACADIKKLEEMEHGA